MNWLLFAFKNTFRNRRRALITILIATLGVASIMISGGFALFTYEGLKEQAARGSGHLILAHKGYFDQEEDTPMELGLSNYSAIREQLSDDRRIRSVLPRVVLSGLISNGDKSSIFVGSGIDTEEFAVKGPFLKILEGGRLSRNPDNSDGYYEVMLAKDLARSMGAHPGGTLTILATTSDGALNAVDVLVKGIFTTGIPDLDKRMLYLHTSSAQELLVTDKISTLSIYLYETPLTDTINAEMGRLFPELDRQSWLDQAFFYQKVRDLYNRIFGTLGLVIVIMVFFSISNTMSMVVVERTREIGTLAAMGTYGWEIIRNFILEAIVIATSGALLGLMITYAVTIMLQFADIQMPPPPGRTEGYPLIIYFSTDLALYTVAIIIAVCIIAAGTAAWRGIKKPVVEALSHV